MFNPTIDLGQIIIGALIAVIGWFIRNEISSVNKRLDKHDELFLRMTGTVQRLIGTIYRANPGLDERHDLR